MDSAVVFAIDTIGDDTPMAIPFANRSAWREIQNNCPSIEHTKLHLRQGTRPSKKSTKINDTKRYLQTATLAQDGLVVVRSHGAFTQSTDRIVIPRSMVQAILTAIHIRSGHPTAHQLKQVFIRNFAALDLDHAIKENVDGCHKCASLKRLPKHITSFTTSDAPKHIGQTFSVDVLR
jgi:hypothetical protein